MPLSVCLLTLFPHSLAYACNKHEIKCISRHKRAWALRNQSGNYNLPFATRGSRAEETMPLIDAFAALIMACFSRAKSSFEATSFEFSICINESNDSCISCDVWWGGCRFNSKSPLPTAAPCNAETMPGGTAEAPPTCNKNITMMPRIMAAKTREQTAQLECRIWHQVVNERALARQPSYYSDSIPARWSGSGFIFEDFSIRLINPAQHWDTTSRLLEIYSLDGRGSTILTRPYDPDSSSAISDVTVMAISKQRMRNDNVYLAFPSAALSRNRLNVELPQN